MVIEWERWIGQDLNTLRVQALTSALKMTPVFTRLQFTTTKSNKRIKGCILKTLCVHGAPWWAEMGKKIFFNLIFSRQ